MLVILHQAGLEARANSLIADLANAFGNAVPTQLVPAETAGAGAHSPSWDDLLIFLFNESTLPAVADQFITAYLESHKENAQLLPVALSETTRKPPGRASEFKALPYEAVSSGDNGRLVQRIGAMLGLRLQGREAKIFLSHRASDGAKIAAQLHAHLSELGYRPWLDQAKEIDGDTMIMPGSKAQTEIDDALSTASLILLLDTPDAPSSPWIKHEVDTADGLLTPILPVWFRAPADRRIGPRFRSLLELQRWIEIPMPAAGDSPLSAAQLQEIVTGAEQYLCEIIQRKCRVPFLVEREFKAQEFSWDVLDQRLLMYRSSRKRGKVTTQVLNHCSIFDQVYGPALTRFRAFLNGIVPRRVVYES